MFSTIAIWLCFRSIIGVSYIFSYVASYSRRKSYLSLAGDNFIRLEFNLVLVVLVAVHVTSCKFLNLGWLINLIAGVLLCYGTYSRKRILSSSDWSLNAISAVNADGQAVENYLVLSLLTWIASTLFEIKSFTFLFKIGLGSYKMWKLSKKDFVFLLLSVLASANASWVMLQFTSEVHQSFECITRDELLLIYFFMAALAKNIRVFCKVWECDDVIIITL